MIAIITIIIVKWDIFSTSLIETLRLIPSIQRNPLERKYHLILSILPYVHSCIIITSRRKSTPTFSGRPVSLECCRFGRRPQWSDGCCFSASALSRVKTHSQESTAAAFRKWNCSRWSFDKNARFSHLCISHRHMATHHRGQGI